MTKLTIIGSGSMVFTRRIVTDLLLMEEFSEMELSLMDIDPERLRISELVVKAIANEIGVKPNITCHTDRKTALKGADFVQTPILTGGYSSTKIDFNIPEKYGLKQTIADTVGIGGIMKGIRTLPALLDIAKDILETCPNAIWLQSANPMAMTIMAISRKFPEVNVVGLCHSVPNTAMMLADDIGEKIDDIVFKCAGINHMSFYLLFEKKLPDGSTEDLYPKLKEIATSIVNGEKKSSRTLQQSGHGKFMSEKVRYEMLIRLGYFVTESSEHFSEYVPWFIKNNNPELISKYEIPLGDLIDRDEYKQNQLDGYAATLKNESRLETFASNEYATQIIRSVANNYPIEINGNVMNNGLIDNLPDDCCVEVPCTVDKNGISPQKIGDLPIQLAAIINTNVNVQQLTVEAVLTNKKEYVYHAAMLDPHTAAELSINQIYDMIDELFEAHGEILPKLK
jgi:alpha-galactosidase